MLELHKKKNSIPPSAEREKIEREIAITDEKIDKIVHGLDGITPYSFYAIINQKRMLLSYEKAKDLS